MLADKVEEISGLISRLEPTLVEQLFARLARSVLALDSGRRQQLLRDTVLPGLLEGRADGRLLRHFPDLELADSLSLLLDLQVAAPEMLRTAFERLDLPSERQARMKPIIDERVAARRRETRATDDLRPGAIDGLAEGGIRVEGTGKDFRTFTTFDLSLDPATRDALGNIAAGVDATDLTLARLTCARDVLAVEANPEVTAGLVALAGGLLGEIESRKDWLAYAALVSSFGALAQSAHEERPEVADQVRAMLAALATSDLCLQLARLAEASPESSGQAAAMFAALGPEAGPSIADALGRADDRMRRALVKLAAAQAPALTPALLPALAAPDPIVVRHVVQIIGHVGPGVESTLAPLVAHADEWVARETCRALARIGTPEALAAVSAALTRGGRHHALAEEALWRFPAPAARDEARRLLGDRDFVRRQPGVARALLARFAEGDARQAADAGPAAGVAAVPLVAAVPDAARTNGFGRREADMTTPLSDARDAPGRHARRWPRPDRDRQERHGARAFNGPLPGRTHRRPAGAAGARRHAAVRARLGGRGAARRDWRRRAPRRTGVSPGEHGAPAGRRGLHLARDWTACTWTAASRATSWPRWPPSWPDATRRLPIRSRRCSKRAASGTCRSAG